MRIVIALGGNALLKRGEALTAANQRTNVRIAAEALAPLCHDHQVIISHGNGPQVGMLAMQEGAFPLDVLGAQTEGMIGYMIEQELGNILPFEQPFASILTMVEVYKDDPAFLNPSKPIGPLYKKQDAQRLIEEKRWCMKKEQEGWRRVVPSPIPRRIFQLRPIKWLLEKGTIVICTGGGGIPTVYTEDRKLVGAEVVIDKDYASALLAKELEADMLIMATDADAVYSNWGTSKAVALRKISYNDIKQEKFASGSMGPKVISACWFAETTGKIAAIGALADLEKIVKGEKGTIVLPGLVATSNVFGLPVEK
jgi:carbamate kinase